MPFPAVRRPPAAASPPRSLTAAVRAVQIAYPQIYLACHTRHTRARSSAFRLSARAKGAEALSATSVLEAARGEALLRMLPPADRARALDGLTLLGRAARGPGERTARSQAAR
jgi:hypothetical protein